jgi:hypothetical protein
VSHWPLLSLVTFVPLIGAFFILIVRGDDAVVARNARFIALWTSLIVFALSIVLWVQFDPNTAAFQFVERANWISLGGVTITYHMGIDGISLFFVLLTTILTFITIVSAWEVIQFRVKEFMVAFLVLETLMTGVFCALDFILFYVFFEGVLVPMFLIIGVWGGPNRIYSAFKFFLYTLLGSVLMLLAVLAVYFQTGTTDIEYALAHSELFPAYLQKMALARVFCVLCRQGPDVAGAYLAARRSCGGSDGGLGDPRGHPIEAWRLRLYSLFVADLSARLGVFHAADLRAQRHCGDLYLAGGIGAARHEKAGRLLVDRPYGVCHDGHFCRDQ